MMWPITCLLCNDRQRREDLYLVFVGVPLALTMGLRSWTVGKDSAAYWNLFRQIAVYGIPLGGGHSEPLYNAMNAFVGIFTKDSGVFFLVESCFTIFLFMRAIRENETSPVIPVLVFQLTGLYMAAFNISRAMLAFSIGLQGLRPAREGKPVLSLIPVLIATFFHTSSLSLALMYIPFFIKNNITDMHVIAAFSVPFMFGVFSTQVINLIVHIIPRYAVYGEKLIGSGSIGLMGTLLATCSVISLLSIRDDGEDSQEIRALAITLVLGLGFSELGRVIFVAGRIYQMSFFFLALLLPRVARGGKWWPFAVGGICVVLGVYYVTLLMSGSGAIIPYATWI